MYELQATQSEAIDKIKNYIVEFIEEFKNGHIGDITTYKTMLDVIKILNNELESKNEVDIQISGDWYYIGVKRKNGQFVGLWR